MEPKWITDVSEVPDASDESLKNSLITCDARGPRLKRFALQELLQRAKEAGRQEAEHEKG